MNSVSHQGIKSAARKTGFRILTDSVDRLTYFERSRIEYMDNVIFFCCIGRPTRKKEKKILAI